MVDRDSKISAAQFLFLGAMMGDALFVGMGNIILVQVVKENTWLNALIGIIVGILPMLILVKIMNYQPSLNLIDKIRALFSPIVGHIINFLIFVIVLLTLLLTIWAATEFASTKYLSETPFMFVSLLFMIPAAYAALNGIETISRSNQLIFLISLIIHFILTTSLFQFVTLKNIMPILADGIKPLLEGVPKFITYCGVPFITLLIIPKNQLTEPRKASKYLVLGYIIGAGFMALVFFMGMSSVGIDIAAMYKYPEYYIVKKISIANAFDNVENFLSTHWIFNLFSVHMMGLYYSREYISNIFKVKKEKTKKIITVILGLIAIYVVSLMFPVSTEANHFMNYTFPAFVGLPLLIIITLIMFKIIWRNIKSKKKKYKNISATT